MEGTSWVKLLCALLCWCCVKTDEEFMTTPEIIRSYGYPVEIHHVTTADGYILELHRIPSGLTSQPPTGERRPVVYLQEGLFSTSYLQVIVGPDHSLGLMLADAGYDVWLGNSRGNFYSRSHLYLSTKNPRYWEFSLHERGVYDMPASIDYVLEKTGQEELFFVGFSRGTSMFFIMASERPEYNKKIRAAFAVGANAFGSWHKLPLLRYLAANSRQTEWLAAAVGIYDVEPFLGQLYQLDGGSCQKVALFKEMCDINLFMLMGYDSTVFTKAFLSYAKGEKSLGTSYREIAHLGQMQSSRRFCHYNYGLIGNIRRYGSPVPPSYDLKKVTCPVVLISGDNDGFTTYEGQHRLADELPNVVEDMLLESYNHLDLMLAFDVKQKVNDPIIRIMGTL